jgi:hypothetical protein
VRFIEQLELGVIAAAVTATALLGRFLPAELKMGELLTVACVGWLLQGGLRDTWFLYALKSGRTKPAPRKLACMCLESSAGLTGVLLGVVLALCGIGPSVALNPLRWSVVAAIVLLGGFTLKDFVITWRPWGIRRERDHHSIIFSWR